MSSELPNAQITFDKFHVVGHANAAVDKTRRIEQRTDKSLKGMRWTLLKDVFTLKPHAGAPLHGLITAPKLTRTPRAGTHNDLLNALREGLQPHWKPLDLGMPRWTLTDANARALLDYLKELK